MTTNLQTLIDRATITKPVNMVKSDGTLLPTGQTEIGVSMSLLSTLVKEECMKIIQEVYDREFDQSANDYDSGYRAGFRSGCKESWVAVGRLFNDNP